MDEPYDFQPYGHHAAAPPSREDVARIKLRHALAWVEDAQRSLSRAAENLAPVRGAARDHARVLRLYKSIKREWYAIEKLFARRLDLDRDPLPAELAGLATDSSATRVENGGPSLKSIAGGAR